MIHITTAHEDIPTIERSVNSGLTAVHNWAKTSKLSCNSSKTTYMTIGCRQNLANAKFMNLELDNRPIIRVHIKDLKIQGQRRQTERR